MMQMTQKTFPDFQGFSDTAMQAPISADPAMMTQDPAMMQDPMAQGMPELPELIKQVSMIDPQVIMDTPADIKMDAIRMILG